MKKLVLVSALSIIALVGLTLAQGGGTTAAGAPQRGGRGAATQLPPATGPIADIANASIEAINKADTAFFETRLAPDVVWFDEDGHAIAGKDRVLNNFIKTKLMSGGKKVTIANLRVGNSTDMGWSGYQYTIEAGTAQRKGTQTVVYKKNGNDWQIVMIHGAVNAAAH